MEEIENFGSENFRKIRKLNKIIAQKLREKMEVVNSNALAETEAVVNDDKLKQKHSLRRGLTFRSRNFEEKLYNDYSNEILSKTMVDINDPFDMGKSFDDPTSVLNRIKNLKFDQIKESSDFPIRKKIKTEKDHV